MQQQGGGVKRGKGGLVLGCFKTKAMGYRRESTHLSSPIHKRVVVTWNSLAPSFPDFLGDGRADGVSGKAIHRKPQKKNWAALMPQARKRV